MTLLVKTGGYAQPGDLVVYKTQESPANATQVVVKRGFLKLPPVEASDEGWADPNTPEYTLRDTVTGQVTTSLLREDGWYRLVG